MLVNVNQNLKMARKCFISFKTEDLDYKLFIQNELDVEIIDKSLNIPIESDDLEYIMKVIRQDYLSDSTVTIHLIGARSAENLGQHEQRFIKRELQASLFHGAYNTKNGILGVVLPSVTNQIYGGAYTCSTCGSSHSTVRINDDSVIKEFSYNYYIPKNGGCGWAESDRYCVLVKWEDFKLYPEHYIEKAFEKREEDIAKRTKVRP